MITRNLKNLTSMILQSSSTVFGSVYMQSVYGGSYFANGIFSFPGTRAETFTLSANEAGVSFGTGSTPATEYDSNLESTITGGIAVILTDRAAGCDALGNPWLQYTFTITNTGSEPLTVREVGYKQAIKCSSAPGKTNASDVVCLLDRTVLDAPLEILAGDAGILVYRLKTNCALPIEIGGLPLVSFEWGSDEQIAAMLDAAHAGTIDLQRDAGWRVGNMRKIHIDAFTGGGDTAHAAQDIDIVISSFEDYNSCGCVMQFDFADSLATGQRMNGSQTNVGGYSESEMKTVMLPALVDALPVWLKNRLLTFDVQASAGSRSSEIVTVPDNKLALRSEVEVLGATTNSFPGEGSQIAFYKAPDMRTKRAGYSGSYETWRLRSPSSGYSTDFCGITSSGEARSIYANYSFGIAPFGCV